MIGFMGIGSGASDGGQFPMILFVASVLLYLFLMMTMKPRSKTTKGQPIATAAEAPVNGRICRKESTMQADVVVIGTGFFDHKRAPVNRCWHEIMLDNGSCGRSLQGTFPELDLAKVGDTVSFRLYNGSIYDFKIIQRGC